MTCNWRDNYIDFQCSSCFTLFQNTMSLKNLLISVCFHGFILGRVYQTMPKSYHYRKTAEQTDSLGLIKIIDVTSNVDEPQSSETNKKMKVITRLPYPAQSQIQDSGRD